MNPQTYSPLSCNDFPSDVLKWMKINANPEMALKLMQVCKYFRHKEFPYLVVKSLSKSEDGIWKYCKFSDDESSITDTLDIFIDKNLWITEYIYLHRTIDPFSSFLSKIAVCKAQQLYLRDQKLTIDEFTILSSCTTFEFVNLCNTSITDKNDKIIGLENLLQIIPDITFLAFDEIVPSFTSPLTAASISLPKMEAFEGFQVRETFDFQTFTEFMKAHPSIFCRLSYDNRFDLSPQYKDLLEEYIDKIIADNSVEYPPPIIHFTGEKSPSVLDHMYTRYMEHSNEQ